MRYKKEKTEGNQFITITGKGEICRHVLKSSTLEQAKEKARVLWGVMTSPITLMIFDEDEQKKLEYVKGSKW